VTYRPPEQLGPGHQLGSFACASAEQTDWLLRHARQSMATGTTKVFVVTAGTGEVVAYYAWTMAQISLADAPRRLRKGSGNYPQPVALLARLGVHREHERQGLGAALLRDVIQRVAAISDDIGCRGLLVHCESEQARDFYLHLIPEFESSPTDELHLVLLLKDIKKTLQVDSRKRQAADAASC
jgi:GNAT superfamily N-acetyltransferase